MRVFLDTNIYFDNWFVDSAPFRLLITFLNNAGHRLVISRLVIQEVENKRIQKLAETRAAMEKQAHIWESLTRRELPTLPADDVLPTFDFLANLKSIIERLEIIEYEGIPHQRIVERAMKVQRPFLESEKGYRDTLIWVSLMDNLDKIKGRTEIAFITENHKDFFKGQKEPEFHEGLHEDLNRLPKVVKLLPFKSLPAFLDAKVDKFAHAVEISQYQEEFETYVQDQFVQWLEDFRGAPATTLIQFLDLHDALQNVKEVGSTIYDGVEEFGIDAVSGLNEAEVYVGVHYDIRGLALSITIPRDDFEENRVAIERNVHVYETFQYGSTVSMHVGVVPMVAASFTFNHKSGKCAGYSLHTVDYR